MSSAEIGGLIGGIITILVGILVIFRPRLLAYVIGAYLIVIGIIAVASAGC
jgi:uncharacterized membrane protein HdeD (DUF308 family)